MNTLQNATIASIEQVAEQVYLLRIPRPFPFRAGQVIGVTTEPDTPPRLYSIASGERDKVLQILFNVKPEGALTPALANCKPGDTIQITPPHGTFTPSGKDAWWIATGTGIAPFVSMHRSGIRPIRLIHGGRTHGDLYFENNFRELPDYVKCLTREDHPDALHMRLTTYIESLEALPSHVNYFLCGSTDMVVDVRALLIAKGIPFNQIVTEIYF